MLRITVLALLFSLPCIGLTKSDLYSITLPVSSESSKDRLNLLQTAWNQALIKASGDTDIIDRINNNLSSDQLIHDVSHYHYERENNQLFIHITFAQKTISQALKQINSNIWPDKKRPLTLVWMMDDKEKLVQEHSESIKTLRFTSQLRGLKTRTPLLDLEDQRTLYSFQKTQSSDLIWKASQRYDADTIVIGRITTNPNQTVNAYWELMDKDTQLHWEDNSNNANELVMRMVDHIINQQRLLSSHDQVLVTEQTTLVFENVNDFISSQKILSLLKNIPSIENISLTEITNNSMKVVLKTNISDQKLLTVLKQLKHFQSASLEGQDHSIHIKYIS